MRAVSVSSLPPRFLMFMTTYCQNDS
jgi:hypothetical protein